MHKKRQQQHCIDDEKLSDNESKMQKLSEVHIALFIAKAGGISS